MEEKVQTSQPPRLAVVGTRGKLAGVKQICVRKEGGFLNLVIEL